MAGRAPWVAACVLLLVGVIGGCGTVSERRDDVRDTAAAFETALGKKAYADMCAVLAPGTVEELEQTADGPCAKALSEESPPSGGAVRRTDVYGNQARVVLAADVLFLSRFTGGWRVMAAGCRERPGEPYQCRIKGG
ncbi:hypothetical protein [Streptomyces sp. NPDC093568]|uniref:hypothetical protein n=1 Tax=Streptomyces sp. NPDC093568 TaxID=3366041 RepID=UPI00381A25CA